MTPDPTDEILIERVGPWGVVTLNRPQALNALNLGMVAAFRAALDEWAGDDSVKAVLVRGAGEKAFCAGGDVRWVAETARADIDAACAFFREEYRLNSAIHHFQKPYVALIDGIVMGGGVGVSVHGHMRVAGDRTLFAMPETGIGLFPDVGGGYFLPRLADGLGLYYALTGARAKAADCLAAGVATHYAPSDRFPDLAEALLAAPLAGDAHEGVGRILRDFSGDAGAAPIEAQRANIACFFVRPATFDGLLAALRASDDEFSKSTAETLARMSPTSCKLTFEQLRRGALLDFDDVMRMEFRMVRRVIAGHDFAEGVRAQLIDKDRNPRWSPASFDAVSDAAIAEYFAPLGANELVLP